MRVLRPAPGVVGTLRARGAPHRNWRHDAGGGLHAGLTDPARHRGRPRDDLPPAVREKKGARGQAQALLDRTAAGWDAPGRRGPACRPDAEVYGWSRSARSIVAAMSGPFHGDGDQAGEVVAGATPTWLAAVAGTRRASADDDGSQVRAGATGPTGDALAAGAVDLVAAPIPLAGLPRDIARHLPAHLLKSGGAGPSLVHRRGETGAGLVKGARHGHARSWSLKVLRRELPVAVESPNFYPTAKKV